MTGVDAATFKTDQQVITKVFKVLVVLQQYICVDVLAVKSGKSFNIQLTVSQDLSPCDYYIFGSLRKSLNDQ